MLMRTLASLMLFLSFAAAADHHPAATTVPDSVGAYLDKLGALEKQTGSTSLEPVYALALKVQDELMAITNDYARIEGLSDAEFTQLQQRLSGFRLSRGVDVFAEPDPAYFLELARKQGERADVAYFSLLQRSRGADLLPDYLTAHGRGVCVRYGEGRIAPYYAGWVSYRGAFDTHYAAQTAQEIADVEDAVGLGTCACSEQESVVEELTGFARAFSTSPATARIGDRLRQLKEDPYRLPVRCT